MKENTQITTCLLPLTLRHQLEAEAKPIGRGGMTQLIIEGLHLRFNSEAGKNYEERMQAISENTIQLLNMRRENARIGGNLNKITHWLNQNNGAFEPKIIDDLKRVQEELMALFIENKVLINKAIYAQK